MVNWHKVGGATLVVIGILAFFFGILVATMRGSEYPPNDYTDTTLCGALITILGLVMIFVGLHLLFSKPAPKKDTGSEPRKRP